MSKMNLIVDLTGYEGDNSNTCDTSFSKKAQYIGIDIKNQVAQEVTIAASSSVTLFNVITAEAKKIIYLESDKECDIIVNGVVESTLKPIIVGGSIKKGIFLKSTDLESVSVVNNSTTEEVKVNYITVQ